MMPTSLLVEPEVRNAIDQYLSQVDSALPGIIEGFYLVGSIALNDYIPNVSDIDFVAVSSRPLTESELDAVTVVHLRLVQTTTIPKFDGIYTTWAMLSDSSGNATVHHWLDKTMHRNSQYGANPVTWATLRKHPVVIRGNPNFEVFDSDIELRDWCKDNLQSYWADWVSSSKKLGARFLASFTLEATCWGVLGVVRLHATIRTGEIISKSQACVYGRTVFPNEWKGILELALSGRRVEMAKQKIGPFKRRSKTLQFMEYVIADASSITAKRQST